MVFSLLGGSPTKKKDGIDTNRHVGKDYDEGPTVLYSLIEKRDWKAVVLRCQKAPMEASTWIYRNEKGGSQLRWRQLPIHAAIIFGAGIEPLEALFQKCPNGAEMQDDQGMTPLHLAFRHDSAEFVIDLLLKMYPDAANLRDRKGRVPITLVHVAAEGEPSTLRTYMANFIMERSTVVAAQHKEKQMRELTEAYTEEIKTLVEEREKEREKERINTIEVQRNLVNASTLFKKWAVEDDVSPMDPANTKHTMETTHESMTSTIQSFADKVTTMAEQHNLKLSNIIEKNDEFVGGLDKEYKKQIEELTNKSSEKIEKKDDLNKENHAQIVSLTDQLHMRKADILNLENKWDEAKNEAQSVAEKNAVLTTKLFMHEKSLEETQLDLTGTKNFHEETKKILNETLTKVNDLEHEKSSLEEKVATLVSSMKDAQDDSADQKKELQDEVEKLEEELELANEALNQASETVQTLEDQMAKLYVEKEEIKTQFFGLQQSSTDTEETQQVYIHELEAENESQKASIETKDAELADVNQQFDGLSTLRDKENEISHNKETALTTKMSEMMERYEEFQDQIASFNERTAEYDADLEQFKEANDTLNEQLDVERAMVDDQQKLIMKARESEAVHIERGQDLAKKLAKVSTECKRMADDFTKEKARLENLNVQLVEESKNKVELLEQIMKQTQHVSDTLTRRCDDYEQENMSLRKSLEEMAKRVVRTSLARSSGGGSSGASVAGSMAPSDRMQLTPDRHERQIERVPRTPPSHPSTSSTPTRSSSAKNARESENIALQKNIANMKAEIENITSSIMN